MVEKKERPVAEVNPSSQLPLDEIREAIEKIRFGSVQLIIQDGRVVQIDTIEKKRLA